MADDPYAAFTEQAAPIDPYAAVADAPAVVQKQQLQAHYETPQGKTAIGRVLSAYGIGDRAMGGDNPMGLDSDTRKALQDAGILNKKGEYDPLKTFTDIVLNPLAAVLDSFNGVIGGTGAGLSQIMIETGLSDRSPDPAAAAEQFTTLAMVAAGGEGPIRGEPVAAPRELPREAPLLERAQDAGVLAPEQPKVEATAPITSDATKVDPGTVTISPGSAANDTAGNINLKNLNTPDDIKNVIRETANSRVIAFGDSSPFIDARRGTQTNAATRDLAQLVGMTPETLLKRQKGEAFNAETAFASRNLLIQSATNVKDLAAKAHGGSDAALLEFEEAVTRHVAIQEQVAGMTAEAGRALQQFRIKAGEAIDVKAVLEQAGGRDKIEAMAQALATMTPEEASAALPKMRKAGPIDTIREAWVNGLLSTTTTHQANMIGNAIVAGMRVPEQYGSAFVGLFHSGEKVSFREANATVFGLVQGVRDGLFASWKALKSGEPADLRGKLEMQAQKAIPGVAGAIIRTPGRLLMTEDEFFKAMNRRASINELAVRQAKKEGLDGKELTDRIAKLKANPPDKLLAKADEQARYYTLQSDLGEAGKLLMRLREANKATRLIGGFVVPFIRVAINISKYATERSPLGLISMFGDGPLGQALTGKLGKAQRDIAFTRIGIGTGVGLAVTSLAAEGFITGNGPSDPAQRATMYASGWLPYSVKIGDKWHSYNRYDPLGLLIGVWADLHEVSAVVEKGESDKILAQTIGAVSNALVNKTWLSGPAQLISAIQDPERYGDQYVRSLAGTVVPGIVAQTARAIDPVARDARSMTDQILSRIPFKSVDIPGKRDIFGELIVREGSAFQVGAVSTARQDPVVNELLNLGVFPAKLDRAIKGVDLTAAQYDEYQMVSGRLMHLALANMVNQPGWAQTPAFARKDVVTSLINSSREQGRAYMLMKYPQILEDAIKAKTAGFTQ